MAISAGLADVAGAGGIGFIGSFMRLTQRSTTRCDGVVTEGAIKFAYVTSGIGTPVKGGFPWQLWHRFWSMFSTSQNPADPVAPPEPDVDVLVVPADPLAVVVLVVVPADPPDVLALVVAPADPPTPPCPAPGLLGIPDPLVPVADPDSTS